MVNIIEAQKQKNKALIEEVEVLQKQLAYKEQELVEIKAEGEEFKQLNNEEIRQ